MRRQLAHFDYFLFALVLGLIFVGIIMIGSATNINVYGASYEYSRQKIWALSGLVLFLAAAFIDYQYICRFYILIYILNIVLLVLVLFLGARAGDSFVDRWLALPGGVQIQPSEFCKVFMILFLANLIDKENESIDNIYVLAIILTCIAVPVLLIMSQPSLSASLVVLFVSLCILFVGGINYRYVLFGFAIILVAVLLLFIALKQESHDIIRAIIGDYQTGRIVTWFNPPEKPSDDFYQTLKSIQAIGSGQLTGKGIYNSITTVPHDENDFIFAIIGGEFGFLGCMIVLAVMAALIARCLVIASRAPDLKGRLIATGVAAMFTFQVFVNAGVATGLLPNTGMSLPFISYGGSSMWINMISAGLVINVGMARNKSIFKE